MLTNRAEELKKLLARDTTSSWAYEGLDVDFTTPQTAMPTIDQSILATFYYRSYSPMVREMSMDQHESVRSFTQQFNHDPVDCIRPIDQMYNYVSAWSARGFETTTDAKLIPFPQLITSEYKYLPRE